MSGLKREEKIYITKELQKLAAGTSRACGSTFYLTGFGGCLIKGLEHKAGKEIGAVFQYIGPNTCRGAQGWCQFAAGVAPVSLEKAMAHVK